MSILNSYQRTRTLLICAAVVSLAIFYGAGSVFQIPYFTHQESSILQVPAPGTCAVNMLIIAVVLFACTAIGTLIAGTIRFDAGLFAAVIGLSALSMRGGPMGIALRSAADRSSTPSIFLTLAFELLILYALVGLAWSGLWLLHRGGWLKGDEFRDGIEDVEDPLTERAYAMLMQAGVMLVVVVALGLSDSKQQALLSVFIGALAGTLAAHSVFPVRPSPWFWSGPLIVGLLGYLLTYFNPEGWRTGHLTWALAPLARPVPLDYVSAGPAGAILGYWTARRWQRDREAAQKADADAEAQ